MAYRMRWKSDVVRCINECANGCGDADDMKQKLWHETIDWLDEGTKDWMKEWKKWKGIKLNETINETEWGTFPESEWMNEWRKEWRKERTNERMNESTNEWMKECVDDSMNECMHAMNEWTNEWINQWSSESVNQWFSDSVNQSVSEWVSQSVSEWVEWMEWVGRVR